MYIERQKDLSQYFGLDFGAPRNIHSRCAISKNVIMHFFKSMGDQIQWIFICLDKNAARLW